MNDYEMIYVMAYNHYNYLQMIGNKRLLQIIAEDWLCLRNGFHYSHNGGNKQRPFLRKKNLE